MVFSQDWGSAKSANIQPTDFKLFNIPWKSTSNQEISWLSIASIVILICFLANTILFMLGKAFELDNIKKFAISEFFQTTATALMIVFFLSGITAAFDLIQKYFLPSGSSVSCNGNIIGIWDNNSGPFTIIKCKISEYLSTAYSLFNATYIANIDKEVEGSQCYGTSGFTECKIWNSDLYREVETYHYIANRLTNVSISLVAQYFFIDYLQNNLLSFFLPVGLLLRLFPPLRGIGSLFIAIVIGFYFIFPLTYLFIEPSIKIEEQKVQKPNLAKNVCFSKFSPFVSTSLLQPEPPSTTGLQFSSDIGQFIVEITLGTFFYPFLSLVITVIFINFLAGFLSADSGMLIHFIAKNL